MEKEPLDSLINIDYGGLSYEIVDVTADNSMIRTTSGAHEPEDNWKRLYRQGDTLDEVNDSVIEATTLADDFGDEARNQTAMIKNNKDYMSSVKNNELNKLRIEDELPDKPSIFHFEN